MGWTFSPYWTSKKNVIDELIRSQKATDGGTIETLKHCVKGEVLWTVQRTTRADGKAETWIGCYVLSRSEDHGAWGYKDMCESMGPYYYSCPLPYLEMADSGINEAWRSDVRKNAATKAAASEFLKSLKPGDRFQVNGIKTAFTVKARVGNKVHAVADDDGRLYAVKANDIEVMSKA